MPKAVDNIEDYEYADGEIMAGYCSDGILEMDICTMSACCVSYKINVILKRETCAASS